MTRVRNNGQGYTYSRLFFSVMWLRGWLGCTYPCSNRMSQTRKHWFTTSFLPAEGAGKRCSECAADCSVIQLHTTAVVGLYTETVCEFVQWPCNVVLWEYSCIRQLQWDYIQKQCVSSCSDHAMSCYDDALWAPSRSTSHCITVLFDETLSLFWGSLGTWKFTSLRTVLDSHAH